jgi:hypothetical protein
VVIFYCLLINKESFDNPPSLPGAVPDPLPGVPRVSQNLIDMATNGIKSVIQARPDILNGIRAITGEPTINSSLKYALNLDSNE